MNYEAEDVALIFCWIVALNLGSSPDRVNDVTNAAEFTGTHLGYDNYKWSLSTACLPARRGRTPTLLLP